MNEDDRSSAARGLEWATLAMSVALEMVIPGLLGALLDRLLGLRGLFVFLGFAGGMALGISHVVRFGRGRRSGKSP